MFNMIINSFKFNNAYYTNAFIYRLRALPIIGKKIPKELYGNYGLKIIVNFVVAIYELVYPFIGKTLYLLLALLPISYFEKGNAFINIFVFLTMVGAFCNTDMFNPTKRKYYSIVLMRMNPKKYAISNLLYFLLKLLISFYPVTILFGRIYEVNICILCLMPIFVVLMKLIGNAFFLKYYEIKKKVLNENNVYFVMIVSIIGVLLAYLPAYLGYGINDMVFIILFIISAILGVISFKYILKCNDYNKIYKEMLDLNTVIFNASDTNANTLKKQYSDKIDNSMIVSSDKKGYEYFNEIFTKRHRGILTKSAITLALIALVIIIILAIATVFDQNASNGINNTILTSLPYFVFIMYFINRGSVVTQAMFVNCDHSMLAYRFYRDKKVILNLFKTRLKTIIKINLIPAIVLALGLPLLLLITGGSNNFFDYILLFLSIISLSVFFSVHHLVIYYLLQPYDINMKAKSSTYSIVNGITYFICYMCMDLRVPTTIFATSITIFAILYVLISLFLVYKYAPKTFKLK